MPELPDITVYIEHLSRRTVGQPLLKVQLASPFLLRSVAPPLRELEGRRVEGYRRLGKRIVMALEGDQFLVLHLMIAGRLRWKAAGTAPPKKVGLAAFHFPTGAAVLTEASTRKRASLYAIDGEAGLASHDPGGLEVLEANLEAFSEALRRENRTLKRALTDPRLLSGIGNAYSDEILHRAGLSPVTLTCRLDDGQLQRLFEATRERLIWWTDHLRQETGDAFPEKVTAFRPEMAVHGRFGQPCPACGTAVQRLVYASNEANYCPRCQTQGKLLADRSLSKLLKKDWPKTVEELEERMGRL